MKPLQDISSTVIVSFFFREKQTEGQRNWISTEKNPTEKTTRKIELSLS